MIRFALLIGLALPLLAACGTTTDEPGVIVEPDATEAPEALMATEGAPEGDIAIPAEFAEALVRENTEHYTFGCVYSYDIGESGYAEGQVQDGLPLPATERWAVGTLGYDLDAGDATYITFYDPEGEPTGATEFTQIDEAERACLLPAP